MNKGITLAVWVLLYFSCMQNWLLYSMDESRGRTLERRGHQETISKLLVSPDGKRMCSVGSEGTVWLTKISTSSLTQGLFKTYLRIRCLEFNPDGTLLFVALEAGNPGVWNCEDYTETLLNCSNIVAAAFSSDGRYMVTASNGFSIHVWDVETWELKAFVTGSHSGFISSVGFDVPKKKVYCSFKKKGVKETRSWKLNNW